MAKVPDEYNCTARVYLKNKGLPDIEKWHEQFKSAVGQIYVFRGVELTIEAFLDQKDGALLLRSPELETSLTLAPLQNKLQWNFKKHRPRGPEPSEWVAYEQLSAKRAEAKTDSLRVQVTGPLTRTDQGLVLEVREYFLMTPYKSSY